MKFLENFLSLAVDFLCKIHPRSKPKSSELGKAKIIAHRGGALECGLKENTTDVFDYCVTEKIWAIEFDIQWTKDLVPIVHHDINTHRIFGKDIDISQTQFSELRKLIPEIPTLKEIVEKYSKNIHFFIEVKLESLKTFEEPIQIQAIESLKESLSSIEPGEHYHVMSLNTNVFKFIDFVSKKYQVSIAIKNTKEIYDKTLEQDLGAMTGHYFLTSKTQINSLINKNKNIGLGFIASKNCLYRQVHNKCYWIFTNHPKKINQYLQ